MAAALVNVPSISPKLLVVPNCCWAGHEADLLAVDVRSRRLIEIEIKVSRADLKADAKKDKWRPLRWWARVDHGRRRQWPDKVWKHYYALPAELWSEELIQCIPDPSGIILVTRDERFSYGARVVVHRRAVCNRDAKPIGDGDVLDIARLLNFRYWGLVRKQAGISGGQQPPDQENE